MSEPITKKLSEIIAENPQLRVWGIRRRLHARCERIDNARLGHLEMRWSQDWNAWSHRPLIGVYQQIMVFVPTEDV